MPERPLSPVDAPGDANDRCTAARARIDALPPRQREVLIELAAGNLNKQIAHRLGISERTVKMHRAALFKALKLETTADAIRLSVEAGY